MEPVAKPRIAAHRISLNTRTGGLAVRNLLGEAMVALADWGHPAEARSAVELVLAEALNNVVEHGYGFREGGPLGLEMELTAETLTCTITDHGRPFPDEALPEGRAASLEGPTAELPEGGFGWHLIRQMTSDLHYQRNDGRSKLTLHFAVV